MADRDPVEEMKKAFRLFDDDDVEANFSGLFDFSHNQIVCAS